MKKKLKKIHYLSRKAQTAYKKEGALAMIRRISQYLKVKGARSIVSSEYSVNYSITEPNKKLTKPTDGPIILNWIIPDFAIGAGGHMTLFRMIKVLEKKNVKNRLYIYGPLIHRNTVKQFDAAIKNHFLDINPEIIIGTDDMQPAHAVIASSWQTAYEAKRWSNDEVKGFYFIQDFEADFYPKGADYLFAEQTYSLNLHGITAGSWLEGLMKTQYNMQADSFDLAFDHEVYTHRKNNPNNNPLKICYYARPTTARRAFELGVQAIQEFLKNNEAEIHFFGGDTSFYAVPFKYHNHGVLDSTGLHDLYSQMDLGIVFSLTNHSLVPKEMMATGIPVLELDLPSNRHIFNHDENIILSKPNPAAIAEDMKKILDSPELRKKLTENGLQYVSQFSWEKSGEKVYNIIKNHI